MDVLRFRQFQESRKQFLMFLMDSASASASASTHVYFYLVIRGGQKLFI